MTVDAEGLQIPAELQRDMEALEGLARDGEVSEADLDALRQDVDQLLDAETGVGAELRARATGQRITIVVAAVVLLCVGVGVGTPRFELTSYPVIRMAAVLGLLGALTAVATWRLLRPLHLPPPSVTSSRLLLGAGLLIPFVIALIPVHDHVGGPAGEGLGFAVACFKCLGFGGATGALILALAFLMRRAAVDGAAVAALAGVAAGLTGNLTLQLHCPIVDPTHLVLGHAMLLVVFGVATARWQPAVSKARAKGSKP